MKLQNNDYVNGGMLLQDIETLISIHRSISELCEQDGLGDNARFDRETELAETAINNIRLHGFGQDVIHHDDRYGYNQVGYTADGHPIE